MTLRGQVIRARSEHPVLQDSMLIGQKAPTCAVSANIDGLTVDL